MEGLFVKTYAEPDFSLREARRYAGLKADAGMDELVMSAFQEIRTSLSYRVCAAELPVSASGELVTVGSFTWHSRDLATALRGCDRAVIFAATVGSSLDRQILRYSATSPSRAVLLQGIGAERIESLCDTFEREELSGVTHRPRFSPGYGDFSIEAQRDIFALLDPAKWIGLSLTDSLLMSPTKSVSAIIGVAGQNPT